MSGLSAQKKRILGGEGLARGQRPGGPGAPALASSRGGGRCQEGSLALPRTLGPGRVSALLWHGA